MDLSWKGNKWIELIVLENRETPIRPAIAIRRPTLTLEPRNKIMVKIFTRQGYCQVWSSWGIMMYERIQVKWRPMESEITFILRADSRSAPSQWDTSSLSNAVSHWLGANPESYLILCCKLCMPCVTVSGYVYNQFLLQTLWVSLQTFTSVKHQWGMSPLSTCDELHLE